MICPKCEGNKGHMDAPSYGDAHAYWVPCDLCNETGEMNFVRPCGHTPSRVAERWKKQYQGHTGKWASLSMTDGRSVEQVYDALAVATTLEEIKKILPVAIGWMTDVCLRCGEDVPTSLEVGEIADVESRTLTLCPPCAFKTAEEIHKALQGIILDGKDVS